MVAGNKMSAAQALEILGLKAGASEEEIRAAYSRLMKRVHPDVGGSDFFAKQLNDARDVLLGQRALEARQRAENERRRQQEDERRRRTAAEAERQRLEREATAKREAEERVRRAAAAEAERRRLEREATAKRETEEKVRQDERQRQMEVEARRRSEVISVGRKTMPIGLRLSGVGGSRADAAAIEAGTGSRMPARPCLGRLGRRFRLDCRYASDAGCTPDISGRKSV